MTATWNRTWVLTIAAFALGWGMSHVPWPAWRPPAAHDDEHQQAGDSSTPASEPASAATADSAHDDSVVLISQVAATTLGLRTERVEPQEYWRRLRLPATVIEKPGHSNHSLAAPVNGMVKRLFAVPGQAVAPGDAIVELTVTDEALSQAQLDLLQDITRLDVIAAELERLGPLTSAGTVPGRQQREFQYEQQQLNAKRKLHEQELLVRGLDSAQVEEILATKNLVREFIVRLSDDHSTQDPADAADRAHYTVEGLAAMPGTAVRRGDDLCHLAYHAELYIQGQAFEDEVERVSQATRENWPITAEFGPLGSTYEQRGLPIQYIDNHVNAETQTYSFFLPLPNEVVRDVTSPQGVRFRTWRHKPGQRVRVLVPVERWEQQFVVPAAALVDEGLEVYVFREYHHDSPSDAPDGAAADTHEDEHQPEHAQQDEHEHAHDPEHEHKHESESVDLLEFERVAVKILYRDATSAVLAADQAIRTGDEIVVDHAYELNLALKTQGSLTPGHDHGHDH